MKSKHIGVFSAAVVSMLTAVVVLGGLASLSSADSGGPTVVLSSTTATTTHSTNIPITATFSETVGAFASSSVTATNATVGVISGSGATYTFNVTPTTSGTVTVMIAANMASSTASSTGSQASNILTFTYSPASSSSAFLALSSYSGAPGSNFNAIGTNFSPSEQVAVAFGGATTTTAADASGNFTKGITVPSLPVGSATITATGQTSGLIATNSYFVQEASSSTGTSTPGMATISNVSVSSVGIHSATITWMTDATSSTQVSYGTSSSYGSQTSLDSTATTPHSATITGLSEATLYHFSAASMNGAGTSTSPDMVFVTQSTASSTPLLVTGIDTFKGNATADGTFSNGWEWIIHLNVPDVENNFAMKFSDFINASNSSSTIAALNNIRIWSAQSSNASSASSAMTESGNGYSGDMMLNGDMASTTAGRQIDVHIQVAVPTGTQTGIYSTTFGAMSTTTPF